MNFKKYTFIGYNKETNSLSEPFSLLETKNINMEEFSDFFQSTTFKDVNNCEICEGHIIETYYSYGEKMGTGIVRFKNSRWEIKWINENSGDMRVDFEFFATKRVLKIIGHTAMK